MANAIEVREVSKSYADFSLKNVSFNVPEGAIMGFIGENGAGKSTTIKAMLNIIKKDSGEVRILGLDTKTHENEIKKRIGVVLDESYFHANLNGKNIDKIMSNVFDNWSSDKFMALLKEFKLSEKKKIKQFSKGMKTKLSIAAALAHSPQVLMLDEATSGLDPIMRDEVLDIFTDFVKDGKNSVLMSSHITTDLDKIADYVTFIHEGQIIFSKKKDDLLAEHASDFDGKQPNIEDIMISYVRRTKS